MSPEERLDCVIIGYNETPFEEYENRIRAYGKDSAAYRDLKFSFIDLDGKKINYLDLLNHVFERAEDGSDVLAKKRKFQSGDIPNLAAAYLTNYLRRRGRQTEFINTFQTEKDKFIHLLEQRPLCVAITTTFYVVDFPVREMIEFIRRYNDKTKIVIGGPLIGNYFRNYQGDTLAYALKAMGADVYVNDSQGEYTLGEIVECLSSDAELDRVYNIAYVDNGELKITDRVQENNSLDENYVDWKTFPDHLGATIQTRTARSCAFSCAFCGYPLRAGKLTLTGLDTIEKELDSIKELGYVKNVVFIDDTFNVPLKRFKEICQLLIKKKYQFNWFSYFRCSNADHEAVELMAESGCKGVFLGIESGAPSVLKNMHKAATIEKYANGIDWLHQHDILTFGSFIIGFPGETEQTVNETIEFIEETKLDYYRSQLWYAEGGTPVDMKREEFQITGQGFNWRHATMDNVEAMNHIDRMFMTVENSIWLPQWSFDFWIIPYLMGHDISLGLFKDLMHNAQELLTLELAKTPEGEMKNMQQEYINNMVSSVRNELFALPELVSLNPHG